MTCQNIIGKTKLPALSLSDQDTYLSARGSETDNSSKPRIPDQSKQLPLRAPAANLNRPTTSVHHSAPVLPQQRCSDRLETHGSDKQSISGKRPLCSRSQCQGSPKLSASVKAVFAVIVSQATLFGHLCESGLKDLHGILIDQPLRHSIVDSNHSKK